MKRDLVTVYMAITADTHTDTSLRASHIPINLDLNQRGHKPLHLLNEPKNSS